MKINEQQVFFEDLTNPFRVIRGCCASPGHSYPPHWHNALEILFFVEGSCDVRMNATHNVAEAGDLICIDSGMIHFFVAQKMAHYHGVIIQPSFLESHHFPPTQRLEPFIQNEEASRLFSRLVQESRSSDPYQQSATESALLSLLVFLYRRYSLAEQLTNKRPVDRQIDTVQNIIRFINVHYAESFSLQDISDATRFSANYLCSAFRQVTGTTMRKYINDVRCRAAQTALITEKKPVTEVAMACGFDNFSYFTKTYKSIIGEAPSKTRQKALNKMG